MFTKGGTMLCLIIVLHIHQCLNLCIERERRALLKIEKDIYDPDNWHSSWRKGGDCCNWLGITCHNTTGHVIGLDLHHPSDWSFNNDEKSNESKLNPSLVDLEHLTYLDLSFNNFFGASIPIFIGSLTRLEHLDLSYSGFKGTIPPQLGNLSSLQLLRIGRYELFSYGINYKREPVSFDLRVDDLHWLSGLTSLTHLEIRSVDLSAATDWFHDVSKLPFITYVSFEDSSLSSIPMTMPPLNNFTFLRTFYFDGNELNSTIPGWLFNNISSLERLSLGRCGLFGELPLLSGQVSNLKYLNLRNNYFDREVIRHFDRLPILEELELQYNNIGASISEILWNLTHLTSLWLGNSQIHGSLPESLGNYSQLEFLIMPSNNITGEIPHSIGNLYRLTRLDLEDNKIGGKIPDSIGNLKKLDDLELSTNLLNGEIPHSLFNLPNLSSLVLSNNNLSGEVPKSIANLNRLNHLDLSNNRLIGSIFFSNQSSLYRLNLSNNSFSGMLPILRSISSQLVVINLSNNRFSGTIPDLFNFHPSLIWLQMGNNKLNGHIPTSLKYCKLLILLDLSENKLCGKIPPWIGGTLLSLKVLSLRSNSFIGQIPRELSYLTSLEVLDLSHNKIDGNFSLYFDNFTVMTKAKKALLTDIFPIDKTVYLENNLLNKQGNVTHYTMILKDVILIDVSSNEISGEISDGITKLVGLTFLNMSRNHFIGNIPKNFGAINDLEVLDLSSNELSGEIPSTMVEMTYLSILNLSYNKLSGMIPIGNQFQTFVDPSIYTGNSNLCGWPLLPECLPSNNNNNNFDGKENQEQEYWYGKTWINAGTVVGFVISSWGVFMTLLLNKSMRDLHFYYVDKLYGLISLQFHLVIAKIKSNIMETEMR